MAYKTFITILIILFSFQKGEGQISTRQVSEIAVDSLPIYDSLTNIITLKNCRQYINQQIYILPKSKLNPINKGSAMLGYSDFSIYPKSAFTNKEDLYKPVQYENQFSFISSYNALAGKYFKIIDVIDKTDKNKFDYIEMGLYLKLQSQENQDIIYYQVAKAKEHLWGGPNEPFIFVGYFEKLKLLNKNKIFIALTNIANLNDINNGKQVSCAIGSEWTCVDVTLIETKGDIRMTPIFTFKDTLSNEIAVGIKGKYEGLNTSIKDFKRKDVILAEKQKHDEDERKRLDKEKITKEQQLIQAQKDEAENTEFTKQRKAKMINKYGTKFGSLIAEGKVVIGMTKQMCIEAWGEPSDINKTTNSFGVHEQWVYNLKSYLYFDENILTSIQN